jgi:hypothetical protein
MADGGVLEKEVDESVEGKELHEDIEACEEIDDGLDARLGCYLYFCGTSSCGIEKEFFRFRPRARWVGCSFIL